MQSLRPTVVCSLICLSGAVSCAPETPHEDTAFTGQLVNYAVDSRDGSETIHQVLRREHDSDLRLDLPAKTAIPSGTRARVQGRLLGDNRLAVTGIDTVAQPQSSVQVARSALLGPPVRRVAFLKFHYGTVPNVSNEDFQQMLTTGAQSAKAYLTEGSFGKVNMTVDNFDWIQMEPITCADTWTAYTPANAAIGSSIDLSGYDHLVYWFPTSCSPSGLADISDPTMARNRIALFGTLNGQVLAHEMGHNLGMEHASSWQCGTQAIAASTACSVHDEYGDTFDVMGSSYAQYQGYNKATQEWFDNCNLVTVRRSGVYTLRPIEAPTTATQVLRVPAPPSVCPPGLPDCLYYIEYRQRIGSVESQPYLDNSAMYRGAPIRLAAERTAGVIYDFTHTYLIDTTPMLSGETTPNFLDAPLLPGALFKDPTGIGINVIGFTRAGMRVQISLPTDGGAPTCLDGTTIAATGADATCENRVRDTGETDVDCGGQCGRCADGRHCAVKTDCWSDSCVSGVCVSSGTCTPESESGFCSRLGKTCGAVAGTDNCGAARTVSSCGVCTAPQICGGAGTENVCGQTPTSPCASLCQNAVAFSGPVYYSGNLATSATCHETTANLAGTNCGNFAEGRSFRVNGTTVTCSGRNITLPPKRNGGYCFQASAGDYAWAYFSTW